MADIKRIGVGRLDDVGINNSLINPTPGIFTFDSTTVTFDSMVDTFDFDIVPLPEPPIPIRDYKIVDYLEPDYK